MFAAKFALATYECRLDIDCPLRFSLMICSTNVIDVEKLLNYATNIYYKRRIELLSAAAVKIPQSIKQVFGDSSLHSTVHTAYSAIGYSANFRVVPNFLH